VTRPRLARSAVACVFAMLVAMGCGGCGRRGALEPPPDPTAATTDANGQPKPQPQRRHVPIVPPKQPFILDPLV